MAPRMAGGDFLGALDAQANVSIVVADGNKSLEASALSGAGLLLDGHNLQNLVLKVGSQERIDNLGFFDGEREEVNLLEGSDLLVLDEASQLCNGNPLVLLLATAAAST